nr:hypothetical protein [Micromonospora sp. DSM 115978]
MTTTGGRTTQLSALRTLLTTLAPPDAGLHLLPFYPAAGDAGFAADDWFSVRASAGGAEDVRQLARRRRLIVDGIYCHVGLGHRIARNFFADPDGFAGLVHAYPAGASDPERAPLSPRGGSPLRSYEIGRAPWYVWQTFSASAIDIRLDVPEVIAEVDAHMRFAAGLGAWGLRLDAPAYYAKQLGEPQRHHRDAYRLAREIAGLADRHNLRVFAQLDCDEAGRRYFPPRDGYHVPIVDYAYPAYLVLAILTADAAPLRAHLLRTSRLPHPLLRSPRTHDGILLRSALLTDSARDDLVRTVRHAGVPVRIIDGHEYELNSSFPFLCALDVRPEQMWKRLALAVAVSAFTSRYPYLYLPMLLGHMPESSPGDHPDPRMMNRAPVPAGVVEAASRSGYLAAVRTLLAALAGSPGGGVVEPAGPVTRPDREAVLALYRPGARALLLANFDRDRPVRVGARPAGRLIAGTGTTGAELRPLEFGWWVR